MILRLWRAGLRGGAEAELLGRLREIAARLQGGNPRPLDFTYGFRQEAGRTLFVAVSVWPDVAAVDGATEGDLTQTVRTAILEDLIEDYQVATYEDIASSPRVAFPEGGILAIVTARVRPQHEAVAQEMVERSVTAAVSAGALAAHLGRRLDSETAELAITVIWPKRDMMTRFVQSRDIPAIDPAFTAHLSSWRFETYSALTPDRLTLPSEGPAIAVMDADGRFIEATPGVESVLGIPGEVLHGRSILDLAPDAPAVADFRRRFLETAVSHGSVELVRPDGLRVRTRYRSVADVPAPGLRSVVLALPGEPDDDRVTADIVLGGLGISEALTT